MKKLGYYLFKLWISVGLFCYYQKIRIKGLENVPIDKPVLFLSNHQNALMDVLLLATRCRHKPWFLTRSDVFSNQFYKSIFGFLQMLPIYRIRDGKENLSKNHAIFDHCASLLAQNETILIFPEANHNLQRRVRPLSKGFTRIIDATLSAYPELSIHLVPIGQNYRHPTQIGDSAFVYMGEPILVNKSQNHDVQHMKYAVSGSLQQLTTHIQDEAQYEAIIKQLNSRGADYLNPKRVNEMIQNKSLSNEKGIPLVSVRPNRFLFYLLNLPMVVLWRMLVKPKVPEPEFMTTFRFGFSMLAYPILYLALFFTLSYAFDALTALIAIFVHVFLNLLLIKVVGITSSAQRR